MITTIVWSLGCAHPEPPRDSGPPPDVVDLVEELPPLDDGMIRFLSPIYEVPPHSEVFNCYFGTWSGAALGVTRLDPHQGEFGHHVQMNAVYDVAGAPADDAVVSCDDVSDYDAGNMFRPIATLNDGNVTPGLAPGMAMYLGDGQRWMLQSHYVNPTDDLLLVQDAVDAFTVAEDTVTSWAAPFTFGTSQIDVPTGSSSVTSICTWEADYQMLGFWGHMHDRGVGFRLRSDRDGAWTTLYQTDTWDDSWDDRPPAQLFEQGDLPVSAGEHFEVTCLWDNDTGERLKFPSEMCNIQGMVYSAKAPINCDVLDPVWTEG